ncbi:Hexosyltransferase [Sarracenia purpurea var. burkii]
MKSHQVLVLCFPGQGSINPSLQFAKRLVRLGVKVTFSTTFSALNRMAKAIPTSQGLTVVGFSDGYDNGFKFDNNFDHYMSELERRGSEAIANLLTSSVDKGQPFTHVIYTPIIPWVGRVARTLLIPSTLIWIQPATVLDIFFYYFNGYGDAIKNSGNDPSWSISLPGLPPLSIRDLPSLLLNSNSFNFAIPTFKEHFEILKEETNSKVLVNSFDALEPNVLQAIEKLNLVTIGPLIPSAFLDGTDPSDTNFGGDLFQNSSDYIEWLDSKPKGSVIYVSFGSYLEMSNGQMEEIARGLLETHRPFLWVIRPQQNKMKEEYELSCKEELGQEGIIVPWCSQVEVLSNPSLGCFVTHSGWNSTLESLAFGVPMVAFPLWIDQTTNAKLIEDVWRVGVRVTRNEKDIVEAYDIKRCIEIVMGGEERGEEMRMNARKLKDLAREAVKEGGSSDLNLKTFIAEM